MDDLPPRQPDPSLIGYLEGTGGRLWPAALLAGAVVVGALAGTAVA